MKKKLRKSMLMFIVAITICLSFVVNTSAYSYDDRTVTLNAYLGFTATGAVIYSSAEVDWFAGRTNSPIAHWQRIQVQLYCRDAVVGLHWVNGNIYEEQDTGDFQNIYAEYTNNRGITLTYTRHEVAAYDCGNWYSTWAQTSTDTM